jgi:hypothetical protein
MICEPCRKDEHTHCPELARQAAAAGAVRVTVSEIANGQRCDCQHKPRRARDPAPRPNWTPMRNKFRRPA